MYPVSFKDFGKLIRIELPEFFRLVALGIVNVVVVHA